jgi:hypothetical protein
VHPNGLAELLRRAARLDESSSLILLIGGLTPFLGPPALVALGIGMQQRRWPLAGADERRGRGWATTWPRNRWPLPPLMRLDHVLVSPEIGVRSVREGIGQGSDHRPPIADLVLLDSGGTVAAVAAVVDEADLGVEAAHLGLENQLDRTQLQAPPAPGRLVIDRGGRPAARAGQPPRPAARHHYDPGRE